MFSNAIMRRAGNSLGRWGVLQVSLDYLSYVESFRPIIIFHKFNAENWLTTPLSHGKVETVCRISQQLNMSSVRDHMLFRRLVKLKSTDWTKVYQWMSCRVPKNCQINRDQKVRNAEMIDSNVRYFNEVDDKYVWVYQVAYIELAGFSWGKGM